MHFSGELPLSALFNRLLTASNVTQWTLDAKMKKFELNIEKVSFAQTLVPKDWMNQCYGRESNQLFFDEKFQVKTYSKTTRNG